MKGFLCGLLSLLLCFSLLGCQNKEPAPILEPVTFFYPQNTYTYTNSESILGSETREAADHKEDLAYLLEQYFQGPQSQNLSQPFPSGCHLISSSVRNNNTITLVLSDAFATLTGMELTIACVCLAKTVTGVTGYPSVVIRAETQLLDGKRSLTIRDGNPALFDDYIAPTITE
jgi:hypothetical protein